VEEVEEYSEVEDEIEEGAEVGLRGECCLDDVDDGREVGRRCAETCGAR